MISVLSNVDPGFVLLSGAAHGLSSILQMLMSFPNICKTYEPLLRQSVDFVLSVMQRNGNTAPAMDEVTSGRQRGSDDELVHWCHGAAGKTTAHWSIG